MRQRLVLSTDVKPAADLGVDPVLVAIEPGRKQYLGGVSRSSVYTLAARGEFRMVHIGGRVMIPVADLQAFVERSLAT